MLRGTQHWGQIGMVNFKDDIRILYDYISMCCSDFSNIFQTFWIGLLKTLGQDISKLFILYLWNHLLKNLNGQANLFEITRLSAFKCKLTQNFIKSVLEKKCRRTLIYIINAKSFRRMYVCMYVCELKWQTYKQTDLGTKSNTYHTSSLTRFVKTFQHYWTGGGEVQKSRGRSCEIRGIVRSVYFKSLFI